MIETQAARQAVTTRKQTVKGMSAGRKLLLWTHMTLGLSIGLFFVMMGLSGASMIFRPQIEPLVYPELMRAGPGGAGSADACYAAARQAAPNAKFLYLLPPIHAGASMSFVENVKSGATVHREMVYASARGQGGCTILGARRAAADPLSWIMGLHHSLLLGTPGQITLGYLGCGVIVLLLSGLMLWWPKRWTPSRFKFRASARPLHYALGFWVLLPLLTAAVTGTYLGWKDAVTKVLVHAPAPPAAAVAKAAGEAPKAKVPASLDATLAAFHEAVPSATPILVPISKLEYPINVDFVESGQSLRQATGRAVVTADAGGVRLAKVTRERDLTGMQQFLAKAQRVHQAEWGGVLVKIVWCCLGMMPAILFLSGFLLWSRRVLQRKPANVSKVSLAS